MWAWLIQLKMGKIMDIFYNSNEPSISLQLWDYLDYLGNC